MDDPTIAVGVLPAGHRVAFLPAACGDPRIPRGELRRVLPELEGTRVEVQGTFPPKRASVPAVRAFIDLLVEVARAMPA